MDSIICIVLGMLFANGVPHFVKGITAEKWDVPWKKPASASTNVLWGIANWLSFMRSSSQMSIASTLPAF